MSRLDLPPTPAGGDELPEIVRVWGLRPELGDAVQRLSAAVYADSIGPELRSIIPLDDKGALGTPTSLVRDAHAAGFNLGKIEDVVDDGEQVIGGGIDPAEPSALSGIKIRLQQ